MRHASPAPSWPNRHQNHQGEGRCLAAHAIPNRRAASVSSRGILATHLCGACSVPNQPVAHDIRQSDMRAFTLRQAPWRVNFAPFFPPPASDDATTAAQSPAVVCPLQLCRTSREALAQLFLFTLSTCAVLVTCSLRRSILALASSRCAIAASPNGSSSTPIDGDDDTGRTVDLRSRTQSICRFAGRLPQDCFLRRRDDRPVVQGRAARAARVRRGRGGGGGIL